MIPLVESATVTLAPGTTAPLGSFTVPVIDPVCAEAMPAAAAINAIAKMTIFMFFIIHLFVVCVVFGLRSFVARSPNPITVHLKVATRIAFRFEAS